MHFQLDFFRSFKAMVFDRIETSCLVNIIKIILYL